MKSILRRTAVVIMTLLTCQLLPAQSTLALSSATATAGSPVSLDLTLASSGLIPAGL